MLLLTTEAKLSDETAVISYVHTIIIHKNKNLGSIKDKRIVLMNEHKHSI